jgi:phosphoribosylaminoimidazole-succinocarboxamide synthase
LTARCCNLKTQNYEKGVRDYCGHVLPEGMRKSARLPTGPLLTPTTKVSAGCAKLQLCDAFTGTACSLNQVIEY